MTTFLNPTFIISILIALSVHEWAHAMMAYRLGDYTAKEQGRLTLNPISHLDLLGTILFLTVGFGWGKPVPINERNFQHPRRDIALTAVAGPASNLVLALAAYISLTILSASLPTQSVFALLDIASGGSPLQIFFVQLLASSLFINLGLMAFNLLPIAPLDGSKVLQSFVSYRYERQFDEFMRVGPYILLFLLLGEQLFGFPFLSGWITTIMSGVLWFFQSLMHVMPGL
ncbi:hypothetical protein A3D88_01340 [Candidatus Peribacteria bacterium RIFCSPHIGHO2_02_FULL_52_16]|nr:MAG: hypothetical protein A2706_03580 [Candidatus Peribacteria bacterium RIFCSPHIGHO2_01_FULL_51_35]OGJ60964.1 MAG: hypothetical protein A3D88_01340 [Candidatus Peribacteria bacterium RIFCSPHIGHO2_02_FULL_52_16]